MDFKAYQQQALLTDQVSQGPNRIVVPLLGMAGELGSLLVEYKKLLRDGTAHRLFKEQFAEELGDILWYLSNLASKMDISLDAIAKQNLEKLRDRWPVQTELIQHSTADFFDAGFPPEQQLPRHLTVVISEEDDTGKPVIGLTVDGKPVGNVLQDNSYQDDGYRFHDVFHLAHAAILGWSPVLRKILGCKRKANPEVDAVEDGGRASVVEEGIAAFVFDYARKNNFLAGVTTVDYSLLKIIKSLTSGLEVSVRSTHEWEIAILEGYEAWRSIRASRGGTIRIDLIDRSIAVVP